MAAVSHKSFRNKILRTVMIALLVTLGSTAFGLVMIEVWLNEKKLQQDVLVVADILGNRSRAALEFGDQGAAAKNLSAAQYQKHVDAICLYNADGALFSDYSRYDVKFECPPESLLPVAKKRRTQTVVRREIRHYDEPLGLITVIANRSFIYESLLFFVPLLCVLIGTVIMLSSRIIKRVLRSVTMPLEDLHETVQALMVDPYSKRRVTKRTDDEIGQLVEAFNAMLDNIARENLALQVSENRFRTLTANAPIGIFQLDSQHNLVYANDRWHSITETQAGDDVWQAHSRNIAADDLGLYHSSWDRAAQKLTPVLVEYRYQSNQFGATKHLMENIAPLRNGELIDGIIGTLADVSELKNAQKELEQLAFYDPLTGLPNRRFFSDLLSFGLAKAKRSGAKAAVLILDMDNFKRVNDLMGHTGGDKLLQQQAQRIRAAVREQDVVSRMGGDEFTIMLSPVSEISEVTILAKRVLEALNAPLMIGTHTLEVGASIGIALYPNDGESVDDLVRNADMALYEAKGAGRNRLNFFSYKLDLELRESLRMEQKLKQAIRDEALEVYLQPQVDREGKVVWAEALLRWHDAEDGAISPARFIPLAEETGLIHSLGQWVIEQVCYHLSENKEYLSAVGIAGVAVNLSGRQFYSSSLLQDIRRAMDEHSVKAEQIEFELTESVVMDDIQVAIDVMSGLRDLGCRLAIDDFGTGYSSLSYLKRFPIHSLKIDRTFVEDIPHDTHGSEIATAIIAMAHKLRLHVVAEGVETIAQRDFLIAQGCESLQGFLFSKPKSIAEFVEAGRAIVHAKQRPRVKRRAELGSSGQGS